MARTSSVPQVEIASFIASRFIRRRAATAERTRFRSRSILAAIDQNHIDLRTVVENIAARHDEVADLALLYRPQPIRHAEDLRGRKRQRANGVFTREAGIDCLLHRALQVAGLFETIAV